MTPPPPGGGYNAPPPPGGFPGSGQAPNNNLVLAILTTVLCCLPLGVWGIVKAAEVNGKWAQGDYAGAQASADLAKKVSLWGIGVGAVGVILYVVLMLGGVLSLSTY
ncbi:CD225/dispanin family protein [Demequina litorisediminis]|uniref:Interferon-induced transmembrane protein n=2 Tax=Demequina TaxID=577469 RepID=A0ABQ6IJX2_9MICO|nr:CD225/dispanin family protein [Demequina litorisediminis]GMA37438.1 hypothetical protein GCM10025876_36420 [Demequina litorisediminis]